MRNGLHPRAALAVRHAVARHLDVNPAEVWPLQDLREDLGLDAFDLTFIVLRLEDQFDVEVALPALDGVQTVADLALMIADLVTAEESDEPRASVPPLPMARRSSGFRARQHAFEGLLDVRRAAK